MGTVYVFFANGFEEIEAFTVVDVLRRAGMDVELVSVIGKEEVLGAHDVTVVCDGLFADYKFDDVELLVLPGGMPGAGTLDKHEGLKALITETIAKNKKVAAICAAPMVLGKLGLLKGKRVTCYPSFEQYMEGATCTGEFVEVDDNIITGNSPAGAMNFSFAIVRELMGEDKVKELYEALGTNGWK